MAHFAILVSVEASHMGTRQLCGHLAAFTSAEDRDHFCALRFPHRIGKQGALQYAPASRDEIRDWGAIGEAADAAEAARAAPDGFATSPGAPVPPGWRLPA